MSMLKGEVVEHRIKFNLKNFPSLFASATTTATAIHPCIGRERDSRNGLRSEWKSMLQSAHLTNITHTHTVLSIEIIAEKIESERCKLGKWRSWEKKLFRPSWIDISLNNSVAETLCASSSSSSLSNNFFPTLNLQNNHHCTVENCVEIGEEKI